jgi:excisionase family DNA binding protein
MQTLTTKEAAARLGVTVPRVHALIRTGRLPAEKRGRDVFINEPDLKLVENRKPGRPPKVKAEVSPTGEKPKRAAKKGGKK